MDDHRICYLNTDLELVCERELTPLAADLEARGLHPLHVTHCPDGLWRGNFEMSNVDPETNIGEMLSIIEALPADSRMLWDHCSQKEFDIGYDCGTEPWQFNQSLSASLVARLAAAGASIRITIYPERPTPLT